VTPPQSFVEFEWEPNSQNQEFDQTISLRGGSSSHAVDEGGVRGSTGTRSPRRASRQHCDFMVMQRAFVRVFVKKGLR
jgi:hypothetical protein